MSSSGASSISDGQVRNPLPYLEDRAYRNKYLKSLDRIDAGIKHAPKE